MANEIRLPDIGDFKDVPIIEIPVAPGQSVRKDETILTLESDKASMDVPAPEDGVIGEIRVKVGDKVSQGDVLATYSGGEETKPAAAAQSPESRADGRCPRRRRRNPGAGSEIRRPQVRRRSPRADPGGQADFEADILVLGAGPGGYTAASAPRISGRTSFWLTRDQRSEASVSTSAASRPRRCCMSPRSSTTPKPWVRMA